VGPGLGGETDEGRGRAGLVGSGAEPVAERPEVVGAHFDLETAQAHQLQGEVHGRAQLPQRDQAAEIALVLVVGRMVVAEIAVDLSLIDVGGQIDEQVDRFRLATLGQRCC